MAGPDIKALLPGIYLQDDPDGVFGAIVDAYQAAVDGYDEDLQRLVRLLDVETMPEAFLDALLRTLGNPFPTGTLSATRKRQLAFALPGMYKAKGTAPGIVDALAFFGFLAQVDEPWTNCWMLGVDDLGWGTWLAPDEEVGAGPFQFVVWLCRVPTSEEEEVIRQVVGYMAPPECSWTLAKCAPWDGGEGQWGWDDGGTRWDVEYL